MIESVRQNRLAETGPGGTVANEKDLVTNSLEVWLATNRRAYFVAGALGVLLLMAGLGLYATREFEGATAWLVSCLSIAGLWVWIASIWASRHPRIGFDGRGEVLFYIKKSQPIWPIEPIRIPIDVVECFFLGQGPSGVQNRSATAVEDELECRNIVVRLAERAVDWQHGSTNRRVARWCDGYITLVGTWCEPISAELLGQLNHRLAEAKRRRNDASRSDLKTTEPNL